MCCFPRMRKTQASPHPYSEHVSALVHLSCDMCRFTMRSDKSELETSLKVIYNLSLRHLIYKLISRRFRRWWWGLSCVVPVVLQYTDEIDNTKYDNTMIVYNIVLWQALAKAIIANEEAARSPTARAAAGAVGSSPPLRLLLLLLLLLLLPLRLRPSGDGRAPGRRPAGGCSDVHHLLRTMGLFQAKYVSVKKHTDLVNVLVHVLIENIFRYRCI